MLEFYPLPTSLSHGGGLYPHHPNHGRFLDNRAALGPAGQGLNSNNNNNNNMHNSCMATSPTSSVCSTNSTASCGSGHHHNNNNNNNNNSSCSPTSIAACPTTASLTKPAISVAALTPAPATATTAAPLGHHQQQQQQQQHPPTAPTAAGAPTTTSTMAVHTNQVGQQQRSACAAALLGGSPTPTGAALTLAASASSSSSAAKSSGDCSGRTEVGHIKCEKNYEICEGCGQKIHDRYLMNVGDTNWHEHCLACCYCGMQMHHTCYVRNAKIYCKLDYERLFSVKCAACCHPVLPQEMVMRPIPNYVFHLTCFVCFACRQPLQKGEQFMLRDGQLFCFRHDFEKELYLAAAAAAAAQHCGFVGLDDEDLMRPRDGRRGPKRPRTILTSQQRKQFKASFDQSPKPCRKVREALAKDTGLSVRVVQVWFQNQRAKMKKIQRKAKNGGSGRNGSGSGGGGAGAGSIEDKDKEKEEKSGVKQECAGSESGSGGYLNLADSSSAFASQPLNPNLPFSPDDYPANSNDSFCSSADLSLDGSNFDQLDDDADSLSLNNLELQSTSSSGHHHHGGGAGGGGGHGHHHHHHGHQHSNPHDMIASLSTSLINPIDKLYLMQNSYFNSEP